MVANICVYAASDKNKPIAIIVPAEPALKQLAKANNVAGNGIEDLAHDEKMNRVVLKELQAAGRQGGLSAVELIEGVVIADQEWTTANVSFFFFFLGMGKGRGKGMFFFALFCLQGLFFPFHFGG